MAVETVRLRRNPPPIVVLGRCLTVVEAASIQRLLVAVDREPRPNLLRSAEGRKTAATFTRQEVRPNSRPPQAAAEGASTQSSGERPHEEDLYA